MKCGLPRRLEAVAAQVLPGKPMADIGTDHAQLPLALVRMGTVPSAIALDIVEGPVEVARRATAAFRDRIDVRRSDGFEGLKAKEAASVCVCGMGGRTMAGILQRGHAVWSVAERLILQPQGMADEVRAVMLEHGWHCVYGEIVEDRRKLFTVETWERGQAESPWLAADLRWGRVIRDRPDPLYVAWLAGEIADIDLALKRMIDAGVSGHPKAEQARAERAVIQAERERVI
jgi:tRNA (adenine22-N1)-methyltransferase